MTRVCAVLMLVCAVNRATAEEPTVPRAPLVATLGSTQFRYPDNIFSVAVSPDDRHLAVAGVVGVRVYEVSTGRCIWKQRFDPDGKDLVFTDALTITAAGEVVAIGHNSEGRTIVMSVNVRTDARPYFTRVRIPTTYDIVALSPDGTVGIFAGLSNRKKAKELQFRNLFSGKLVGTTPMPPLEEVRQLVIAPDGKTLIALTDEGTVLLIDRTSAATIARWKLESRVNADELSYARDGQSFSLPVKEGVAIHGVNAGERLSLIPMKKPGSAFGLRGRDELWQSHPSDPVIDIYSQRTGKLLRTIPEPITMRQLISTRDGRQMIGIASYGEMMIWNAESGKLLPHSAEAFNNWDSIRFVGRDLLVGYDVGWHRRSCLTNRKTALTPRISGDWKSALSPDGKIIAMFGKTGIRLSHIVSDAEIRVLAYPPGQKEPEGDRGGSELNFTSDGQTVWALLDGSLFLWDITGGPARAYTLTAEVGLRILNISRDGRQVAWTVSLPPPVVGDDANAPEQVCISELPPTPPKAGTPCPIVFKKAIPSHDGFTNVRVPDDGRTLVIDRIHKQIRDNDDDEIQRTIVDVKTGQTLDRQRLVGSSLGNDPQFVAPLAGSLYLSDNYSGQLEVCEAFTGLPRYVVEYEPQLSVGLCVFSADGARLAVKINDGQTRVYDLRPATRGRSFAEAWKLLADPLPRRAVLGMQTFAADPAEAITYLRELLPPTIAPDPREVERWLSDLGRPDYVGRTTARRALEPHAATPQPRLHLALKQTNSFAVRTTLEDMIDAMHSHTPDHLRQLRAVEVAVWIMQTEGQPAARALLAHWSSGAPDATLTHAARLALGE